VTGRLKKIKFCAACGRLGVRKFCSDECRTRPAPAVYRFVCPDGRSYVGSSANHLTRNKNGLDRRNPWMIAAFEQHPPETWNFEVLEKLQPGCSKEDLREAEQRHIERLRSWDIEIGFNIYPAVWKEGRQARPAGRASTPRQSNTHLDASTPRQSNTHLKRRGVEIMIMSTATLAGMLDHELRRAIDRLSDGKRQIEEDIAAIEAEIEGRRKRRGQRA
jgi:hypothetical protein